ncbi:NUDIX hydrolase [Actinomadura spongiicola]|uniref:NUDIX hydrolase n=1 Tax=Actinomadura spongiicola TaxID=2303421 RepID=A0A372GNR7_9ACTN|nr:NUDIX domain-containing protein [Actinomadura spongiicola]RFS87047.1 NUDIX hydrolase [Actinomadura spongiicola]
MTIEDAEWKPPIVTVTVDLVIFTVRDGDLQVLLIDRGIEPYLGYPALPGGYIDKGETLEEAALRELHEETGLDARTLHLEQLHAYSDPRRDPRGRVITVAYLALGPDLPVPVSGTDAAAASWAPVSDALAGRLAFDHAGILRDGLERARSQLEHTTVAAAFCVEPFTISDLRHIYEAVWGFKLDPSNFRRKVTRTEGFLEPTGERYVPQIGRPALLYRRGNAAALSPPLLRTSQLSSAGGNAADRTMPLVPQENAGLAGSD